MLPSGAQDVLVALDKLSEVMDSYHNSSTSTEKAKTSMFSSIFRRESVKHKPTPEGEYADTRHVGQLRILLEQLLGGDLPFDRYPALGALLCFTSTSTSFSFSSLSSSSFTRSKEVN